MQGGFIFRRAMKRKSNHEENSSNILDVTIRYFGSVLVFGMLG